MKDKLTKMFFSPERWEYAIAKGVGKDIPKNWLFQLCKEEVRIKIYKAIRDGQYEIAPPHIALIPKEGKGEFREVCVNEPADRVVLSIVNDLLFELFRDKVHPRCMSYLKGVGCGKVVQEASQAIVVASRGADGPIGFKADLSKYFDSVPIEYIDAAFDMVEERCGKSALLDVLRKYYHSDLYIDTDHTVRETYRSLKQGCAVASWLADVILYHIDERLSSMNVYYVRYCDDILCIGPDAGQAMDALSEELQKMQMTLNPKKVEWLDDSHWFKFLGFSIKGASLSMSSSRLKKFQKEIEARTVKAFAVDRQGKRKPVTFARALNSVNRYLYHGDGQGHSWATGILGVVNVREDVDTMNSFVMDALRAVETGRRKIGGLGYDRQGKAGCIVRGRGRNVSANRRKTGDDISGYISLGCMQNAIRTSKAAYDTLVRSLTVVPPTHPKATPDPSEGGERTSIEMLEAAYAAYKHSVPSEKTMNRPSRFYALPESELSDDDMLYGMPREEAEAVLETALADFDYPETAGWFWQSQNDPDLVVLRSWVEDLTPDDRFRRAMIDIADVA